MRKPVEFENFPDELARRAAFGPYRAIVRHIIDGDTLDLLVSVGFNTYIYLTVRVRLIDTPELNSRDDAQRTRAQAARDFLATNLAPIGSPVVVATFKDRQTFGRYVADITLADGRDLAAEVIAAGHAVAIP